MNSYNYVINCLSVIQIYTPDLDAVEFYFLSQVGFDRNAMSDGCSLDLRHL